MLICIPPPIGLTIRYSFVSNRVEPTENDTMKTTLTLAMATWTVLPAFAATRTQGEIFTYDDIIQSHKDGVSDVAAYRNWRERKKLLQEEKELLKLEELRLRQESNRLHEEKYRLNDDDLRLREEEKSLRQTGLATQQADEERLSFGIELAGTCNLAQHKLFEGDDDTVGKINTWGGDITGLYHITPRHAITLRLGYAYGDKSKTEYEETCKDEVSSFTLMPGYRYTLRPSEACSVYAAVHIGLARMGVKETWSAEDWSDRANEHATGFAYSAELGVSYALSEHIAILAAYQFGGNTARATFSDDGDEWKSKSQTYNTFRLGLGIRF